MSECIDEGNIILYLTDKGYLHLSCEVYEALGACFSILSMVSKETGFEYNKLVEDLKEVKGEINE